MQIQKVQSDQQSFGTKVQMSLSTAKRIYNDGKVDKVLRQIKKLEKNGNNDTLFLSYSELRESYKATITQYYNGKLLAPARIIPPYKTERSGLISIDRLVKSYENLREKNEITFPIRLTREIEKLFPYIEY